MDGRADQYALACVAFELLTERAPYERDQPLAVLLAHLSERPPSLAARRPDMPATADQVIARALAKRPEERYASCRDFTDALREAFGLPPYHSRRQCPQAGQPGGGAGHGGGVPVTRAGPNRGPGRALVARRWRAGPPPSRPCPGVRLAGAALAAAAAVPWLPASGPGTPAARIPATTQAAVPARPFAALPAPAGPTPVESAAFKPGTVTLAVGPVHRRRRPMGHHDQDRSGILHRPLGAGYVAFGPGVHLAVGEGGDVFLEDTAGKSAVLTATLPVPADLSGQSVAAVAFGPGGVLAVAYSAGDVYLWDTTARKTTALTGASRRDRGGVRAWRRPGRRRGRRRRPVGHHD